VSAPDVVGLVVAKAPVPGLAKTRLAAAVGDLAAAELAAAALLDTLEVAAEAFPVVHVSLAGDLRESVRREEISAALSTCEVSEQRGAGFGERLGHAHAAVGDGRRLVVQVGMDTPQVTVALLDEVVALAGDDRRSAVLGPASDGGWWVLALRDPELAAVLASVPMSRGDTGALTQQALTHAGAYVRVASTLCDVDELADAEAAAREAPGSRFAAIWRSLECEPPMTRGLGEGGTTVSRR
jgi:hypothetical protein